ncbi:hypothetical protein H5P28_15880 [Ruficoccus amylovorans]|uniref:Uncharacterized protein n=1 Tax=Ruficoccus amylovorans TaxID=1804625 RepID=A0A842HJT5_9BACT|nr:hypothetical protein [Ruficoccus amylovorans]MBC2595747.1 hypothetical protein [Ruficoccus amylovorans]
MTRLFPILGVAAALLVAGCASPHVSYTSIEVPPTGPRKIEPAATMRSALINEGSGIAKSTRYEGVYWTHNDSGDRARIFPVTLQGETVAMGDGLGIPVKMAENKDWEDIASDHKGNLLIGDFGNNANRRKDLLVYVVPEPDPSHAAQAIAKRAIPFHFPEQKEFPPAARNYDVEAIFVANDTWYVLTKHRADADTCLYRFNSYREDISNPLELVCSFGARGMVTGADSLADGSRVAVLVYDNVWLFEPPSGDVNRLTEGKIYWRPYRLGQCEGICFIDADTLLVTNEEGSMYVIPVTDLIEVQ